MAEQFEIPYCVLLDSDLGTNENSGNLVKIQELRDEGVKAYLTRRREPENYIDPACVELADDSTFSYGYTDDAKTLIAGEKGTRKVNVLADYWTKMSAEQVHTVEAYLDEEGRQRYEFTEMFSDFFELV